MIEMRWVHLGGQKQLQYRYITLNVDASGALCPPGEWSEWKAVPDVSHVEYADDPKWISS